MKIRIHVDGLPHEEGCVYLKLIDTGESVAVAAVNERGEDILDDSRWHLGSWLLTFAEDGTIARSPAVFPELGFELDHDGRVALNAYGEKKAAERGRFAGKRATLVKG